MNLVLAGLVLFSAALFATLYFPMLKLSLVLVSPYPKANIQKRMFGAMIDASVVMTFGLSYWNGGSIPNGVAAVLYLLLRDALKGQSAGKFLFGQAVIHVDTGQRCRLAGSIRRNVVMVVPGANLVAVVLEARTLMRDPQGQRLGDRMAHTQVVEGFGARDLVSELQRWWSSFLAELPTASGRPDREPAPVRPHSPGRGRVTNQGRQGG